MEKQDNEGNEQSIQKKYQQVKITQKLRVLNNRNQKKEGSTSMNTYSEWNTQDSQNISSIWSTKEGQNS